ncbi:MAG: low specificity L-threonine aldolase [Clostridiales bacterium]|nr:low specificity L-threonine aldolase [Clostridiales bacterium]
MIRFECDYAEGAHERVLRMMIETNMEQTVGYGKDPYCEKARELVKKLCKVDSADVHFLVGGTQANKTIIASILRPYQGALCASTGHINAHETGAIEATGHKVLALESTDGKITAKQIQDAYDEHWNDGSHEHTVQPGLVYISNPTENGTLYTKQELTEISEVCHKCNLPLFLDGARLGYGIMAKGNDLTVADIARLCDVFYIGGTKVGALFGEAVVITNESLKKDFRYFIKQNGGMLAKGRLLGIQFIALLQDNLYFQISEWANIMAYRIKDALQKKGIRFLYDSMTNQQFPIFEDCQLEKLSQTYSFNFWTKVDATHSAVRICTSWATKEEDVEQLIRDIDRL